MKVQLTAVYSLPYSPAPAKMDELGKIIGKDAIRLSTSSRTIAVQKIVSGMDDAKLFAQKTGSVINKSLDARIEGKLYLREVSDQPEVLPLLFERQTKLDLQEEYKLVFGAVCSQTQALGSVGLYRGSKRIFYSDNVVLDAHQINIAQYEALLHGLNEAWSYIMMEGEDESTVTLNIVSPAELVIKQCRGQWSIKDPTFVRFVAEVHRIGANFKCLRFLLPDEVKK